MERIALADDLARATLVIGVAPSVGQADDDHARTLIDQRANRREEPVRVDRVDDTALIVDALVNAGDQILVHVAADHRRIAVAVQSSLVTLRDDQSEPGAGALNDQVCPHRGRDAGDHGLAQERIEWRAERLASRGDAAHEAFGDVVRRGQHLLGADFHSVGEEAVGEGASDIDINGVHDASFPPSSHNLPADLDHDLGSRDRWQVPLRDKNAPGGEPSLAEPLRRR